MRIILSFLFIFLLVMSSGGMVDQAQAGPTTRCLPASIKARLAQIRKKFGPIRIISTYRRGARIAGTGRRSKHADCRAVDFKVRNKMAVYRWLNKVHNGGLGVYHGRCSHIHIDNGHRARWNRGYCG
jgi:uncharacterized protein YcbK (DUF882 family)